MENEPELAFDLHAASLRADQDEVARAIETLAVKLEGALPSACRVKRRRRWPFGRESRVTAIEVELGDFRFHLRSLRHGVIALRTEDVHDMSHRTERLSLDEWLRSMESVLRGHAASSSEARAALERLLES